MSIDGKWRLFVKVGDLVMFTAEGSRYAKWFFGQIGRVKRVSCKKSPAPYCRVEWLFPIQYYDSFSTISDFPIICYEVYNG